jgi:hypothetical protein
MTAKDKAVALRKSINELYDCRRRTPNNRFESDWENILDAAERELARVESGNANIAMREDAWMALDSFERLCSMFKNSDLNEPDDRALAGHYLHKCEDFIRSTLRSMRATSGVSPPA